ncbi:hypothetical protein VaNZ11_009201, partial [Volvox africanus]
ATAATEISEAAAAPLRGGRPPPTPQPPSSSPLPVTPLSGVRRASFSAGFDSTIVVKEDYGSTVFVHEGFNTVVVQSDGGGVGGASSHPALAAAFRSPAPSAAAAAADYGATTVVGATVVERTETVRRSSDGAGGSADGGYMAAVRAAAVEVQHGDRHARPAESPAAGGHQPTPQQNEVERVRERLQAIYDGGLVVPLPFFKASQAQPLALLRPSEPSAPGPLMPPPLPPPLAAAAAAPPPPPPSTATQPQHSTGAMTAVAAGAAAATAAAAGNCRGQMHNNGATNGGSVAAVPRPSQPTALAAAAALPPPLPSQQQQSSSIPQQRQQPNTAAAVDMHGVDPEAYGVVLELVQHSAAMACQRGEVASEQGLMIDTLPPTVLTQLQFHPALQNLARILAYNRRCLAVLPLERRAQEELQESCNQLSAALQCILSV